MQVANVCSYKLGQKSKFQFWCELGMHSYILLPSIIIMMILPCIINDLCCSYQ